MSTPTTTAAAVMTGKRRSEVRELPTPGVGPDALTVKGVRGHSYQSVEWAIDMISSGRHPLDLMCSLELGLEDVDKAILGTAGELDMPVIHAAVVPSA